MGLLSFLIGSIFSAVLLFALGVPPISDIASHYFNQYHPVARQLRVVKTINEAQNLYSVYAALELGVFDILNKEQPLTVAQLAQRTNAKERGMYALVEQLAQADYLYSVGDGTYINSATASHHLISNLPYDQDMSSLIRLLGQGSLPTHGENILKSVRMGGNLEDQGFGHAETDNHPWWVHFAKVTGNMARGNAIQMVKFANYAFSPSNHTDSKASAKSNNNNPLKVLDVATGSGEYGFEVLRSFKESQVTFQDYENVLEQTAANAKITKPPVDLSRASFLPGNFFNISKETEFVNNKAQQYNVVLATNIIHHFSPERSLEFLEGAFRFTEKNGFIVIVDICPPSSPYSLVEGQSMPRSFSLLMLNWSKHGKAYTVDELTVMLKKVGYKNIQAHSLFPFSNVITAQKI